MRAPGRPDLSAPRPWSVRKMGGFEAWEVLSANGQPVATYLSLEDAEAIAKAGQVQQDEAQI